jgi:hypothetical protein
MSPLTQRFVLQCLSNIPNWPGDSLQEHEYDKHGNHLTGHGEARPLPKADWTRDHHRIFMGIGLLHLNQAGTSR